MKRKPTTREKQLSKALRETRAALAIFYTWGTFDKGSFFDRTSVVKLAKRKLDETKGVAEEELK